MKKPFYYAAIFSTLCIALSSASGVWQITAIAADVKPPTSQPSESAAPDSSSEIDDSWEAVQLMGTGYWENKSNLVIAKVAKYGLGFLYKLEVIKDFRGDLKPGSQISVINPSAGSFAVPRQFPTGAIVLVSVSPDPNSDKYDFGGARCPLGWLTDRVVSADDAKQIAAAFDILHDMLPKKPSDPLDRKKALELFKSHDYPSFAIGASMIATGQTDSDIQLLAGTLSNSEATLAQGVWAMHLLKNMPFGTALPQKLDQKFYEFIAARDSHVGAASIEKADAAMLEKSITDQGVTLTCLCPATLWSGSENKITVTIKNNNEKLVEYYPLSETHCVALQVTRNARAIDKTAWGRATMDPPEVMPRVPSRVLLGKGEELKVTLNITRYFDLSVPGKYEVRAEWDGKLEGADKPLALTTPALACEVVVKRESK